MIIGIMGKAGSGKDTIGFFINDLLKRNGIQAKCFAFATGVKDIAASLTGNARYLFDDQNFKASSYFSLTDGYTYGIIGLPAGHNLITIRELLQKIGTEAMQGTFGKNIWVNKLFSQLESDDWKRHVKVPIITDVRFKHEYEAIKNKNGIVIRVVNPKLKSKDSHISEVDVDNIQADYTIINNWEENPQDVDKQVYELVQQITEQYRNNQILQTDSE